MLHYQIRYGVQLATVYLSAYTPSSDSRTNVGYARHCCQSQLSSLCICCVCSVRAELCQAREDLRTGLYGKALMLRRAGGTGAGSMQGALLPGALVYQTLCVQSLGSLVAECGVK